MSKWFATRKLYKYVTYIYGYSNVKQYDRFVVARFVLEGVEAKLQ